MAANSGRERQPSPLAAQRTSSPARVLAGGRETQPDATAASGLGNQALQGELRSLQHLTAAVNLAARAGNMALQRLVAGQGSGAAAGSSASLSERILDARGRGQETPPELRAPVQRALGADLGDVRVHTDSEGHDLASSVGARAFTSGNHIFFQRGAYDPASAAGRKTVAHELTHVVQQRNGPVSGTPAPGGVSISDPSDTHERAADALAEKVTQPQENTHGHP